MENKKNIVAFFWKESWLLIVCSLCFGLLLAGVNYSLSPKIEKNAIEKLNASLKKVIPAAENFETVAEKETVDFAKDPITIYKATAKGEIVGWAYTTSGAGYADKIKLLIAMDGKCEKLLGYDVLFSNETAGFGDKIKTPYYKDQFAGAPAQDLKLVKLGDAKKIDAEIVAISGATISSKAVVSIFNNYTLNIKKYLAGKGLINE